MSFATVNVITSAPFTDAAGVPVTGKLSIVPSSKFRRPNGGQGSTRPIVRQLVGGLLTVPVALDNPTLTSPTLGYTFSVSDPAAAHQDPPFENVQILPDSNGNWDLAQLNTGQFVQNVAQVTTSQSTSAAATLPANLSAVATDSTGTAIQATAIPASAVAGLAPVAKSGAYADLAGKPAAAVVPTALSAFSNDVGYITAAQVAGSPVLSVAGRTGAVVLSAADVTGLAPVAMSGVYADLTGRPSIPTVPTAVSAFTNDAGYAKSSALAPIALSGSYADLLNKPTIPTVPTKLSAFTNDSGFITSAGAPVQTVAGRTGAVVLTATDIAGLATVATSGSYGDLTGKPTIPTVPSAVSAFTNDAGYAKSSALAAVATSGSYPDLLNKPTIPTVPANVSAFANDAAYVTAAGAASAAPVQSVAGRAGAVTLAAADIAGLATSATTDATNASNIASGTLSIARLPSDLLLTDSSTVQTITALAAAANKTSTFHFTQAPTAATTAPPYFYFDYSATQPTSFNSAGTVFGFNMANIGYALQVWQAGVSKAYLDGGGSFYCAGTLTVGYTASISSTLTVGGRLSCNGTTKNNQTLTAATVTPNGNNEYLRLDASSNSIAVSLISNNFTVGQVLVFIRRDTTSNTSNSVTITSSTSKTLGGASSLTLTQNQSVRLILATDGNWDVW